ncbi:hypothetical protein GCM10022396_20630 [Flavivirga amylovorans]
MAGNKQNTSTNLKLNKGDVVGFKVNGKVSMVCLRDILDLKDFQVELLELIIEHKR